eukprot:scaffold58018_cov20-Tisochrysis_lutea.AAC.3
MPLHALLAPVGAFKESITAALEAIQPQPPALQPPPQPPLQQQVSPAGRADLDHAALGTAHWSSIQGAGVSESLVSFGFRAVLVVLVGLPALVVYKCLPSLFPCVLLPARAPHTLTQSLAELAQSKLVHLQLAAEAICNRVVHLVPPSLLRTGEGCSRGYHHFESAGTAAAAAARGQAGLWSYPIRGPGVPADAAIKASLTNVLVVSGALGACP